MSTWRIIWPEYIESNQRVIDISVTISRGKYCFHDSMLILAYSAMSTHIRSPNILLTFYIFHGIRKGGMRGHYRSSRGTFWSSRGPFWPSQTPQSIYDKEAPWMRIRPMNLVWFNPHF